MAAGYSAQRRVLTEKREFVTDYLLFGRFCWWRRRWQIREGDFLAVCATDQPQDSGMSEFKFWHALFVCRPRRRYIIAGTCTGDRVDPGMELAAQRVAKLVGMPYEGYRESSGVWHPDPKRD